MTQYIGKKIDRIDGVLKVTGAATYSAEFNIKNLAYGVLVQSTISKGSIAEIDTTPAEHYPGVLKVITHKNALRLKPLGKSDNPCTGKFGEKNLLPLQQEKIFYDGQHIAIVIAESFEAAQHAATLIRVRYDEQSPTIDIERGAVDKYKPLGAAQASRGNVTEALNGSAVKMKQTYETPVYHHNAMEPHATIAVWDNDELTVYDGTQAVNGSQGIIAHLLDMPVKNVRLICRYLGGGFGSKGFAWPHSTLAAMASKQVGRPVKIALDRMQMFTSNGHRSRTIQEIEIGASDKGQLQAIRHATTVETSFVDEFIEQSGTATRLLYNCPALEVSHSVVKLNKATPCPTRAPGEGSGTFAFEMAVDELAYELKMDPFTLRLQNYARLNPHTLQRWSSKHLDECYERAAKAMEWEKRNPEPRSMTDGRFLVGYGMATAIYPANRMGASANVRLFPDGRALAACCTQDIGTGTYTIIAQTAAEMLGVPIEKVVVKLGDSALPKGPNSGGSQTSASALPAIRAAALQLRTTMIKKAIADKGSPLYQQAEERMDVQEGRMFSKSDPSKGESYADLLNRLQLPMMEGEADIKVSTREVPLSQPMEKNKNKPVNPFVKEDEEVDRDVFSFQSFGAHVAKVLVDPDLGTVRVTKVVSVMDVGKILNPKTAESQIMGGVIWGIGMALMEQTAYDPVSGRVVTRDLADYLVPVNGDTPEFHIEFIDKPDPFISPIGSRGVGEIGITGITAAIANAIFHATGKRVRKLPITPDKLL